MHSFFSAPSLAARPRGCFEDESQRKFRARLGVEDFLPRFGHERQHLAVYLDEKPRCRSVSVAFATDAGAKALARCEAGLVASVACVAGPAPRPRHRLRSRTPVAHSFGYR